MRGSAELYLHEHALTANLEGELMRSREPGASRAMLPVTRGKTNRKGGAAKRSVSSLSPLLAGSAHRPVPHILSSVFLHNHYFISFYSGRTSRRTLDSA